MKRILCFILVLAIVLVGCISTDYQPENGGDVQEETLPTPQEEPEQPSNDPTEPAYEVVLLASPTDIITVTFADSNLETLVRELLDKPEGDITNKAVAPLVVLTGSSYNITHLTGLQHCINLRYVQLADNNISDISPLANLPGCTIAVHNERDELLYTYSALSLSLSHNQISDISSLGNYSAVDELTITMANNHISDIAVLEGLTNLIALYLNRNNISDISPLTGMTKLSKLDLWGNDISDVSVIAELTALTWLELEQNNVSDITALANLPRLRRVLLSYNQIAVVPDLSGMASLEYLDLRYNQITDDSFLDTLPETVEVRLEGNPIP